MKNFIITFLLISPLFSDYLMTVIKTDNKEDYVFSRCIKSYYTSDLYLYYTKSFDNTIYIIPFSDIKDYGIKSGYYLDDYYCVKWDGSSSDIVFDSSLNLTSDNLSFLGLSDYDLNFLMALTGLFLSALFMFGIFRFI